jgi:cytochrome c oxidase subunit 2
MEQFLGLPPDGSAHGPAIDQLIGIIHWLMLVLFIGWGTFYIFTLIRFRKSRQPQASYTGVKSHFSNYLEVAVLLVEVILLVGFSIPLWSNRVDKFPAEKDATVVRIVAEQFAWNIHYPGPDGKFGRTDIKLVDADNPLGLDRSDPDAKDDITTINQLNLPVNKPVIIRLTSKDVIHSLNFPAYRVKQDAIPGMSIPVWFTPVKTTDAIREELKYTYSLAQATKKVRKITLPQMMKVEVKPGMSMDNAMSMVDYPDTVGGMLLAKGDHLTAENMSRLAEAGIKEVNARPVANLDKFIVMEEFKDSSGAVVVGKNETLNEETVSKLIGMGMNNLTVRQASNMDVFVVMQAYTDHSGNQIAQKGDPLTEELISKFADAQINDIVLAPATPTEIACAQLCGLGHFRMRGYMTVQTPEEFKAWYDQQEATINPPASTDSTTTAVSDSTAVQAQ